MMVRFDDKDFALFFKKFLGVLRSKGKNKYPIYNLYLILYKLKKKI